MTSIVFELNASLLNEAASSQADTLVELSSTCAPTSSDMAPDNLGIIRHCGGWATHKVISAAAHYITDNIFSRNHAVHQEVAHQRTVKAAAELLTLRSAYACAHTAYPSTLQLTLEKDRGALTYLTDAAFAFFVSMEKKCSWLFDASMTEHYKEKTLRHVHASIESDSALFNEFAGVLTGIPAPSGAVVIHLSLQTSPPPDVQHTSGDAIFSPRIVKDLYAKITERYINMRMNRWLKDIRETMKVEKTEALRKRQSMKESRQQKSKLSQVLESGTAEDVAATVRKSTVRELAILPRAALRRAFSLFHGLHFRQKDNRAQLAGTLMSFLKRDSPATTT